MTYLLLTLVNLVLFDLVVKKRSHPLFVSVDDTSPGHDNLSLAETLPDSKSSLDEAYGSVERLRFLQSMLATLPPDTRTIVELCDIEGLKIKEAAVRLGISVSAAKTRHFRANRLLQQMAKAAGLQSAGKLHGIFRISSVASPKQTL